MVGAIRTHDGAVPNSFRPSRAEAMHCAIVTRLRLGIYHYFMAFVHIPVSLVKFVTEVNKVRYRKPCESSQTFPPEKFSLRQSALSSRNLIHILSRELNPFV
jgi:hypothetical protein